MRGKKFNFGPHKQRMPFFVCGFCLFFSCRAFSIYVCMHVSMYPKFSPRFLKETFTKEKVYIDWCGWCQGLLYKCTVHQYSLVTAPSNVRVSWVSMKTLLPSQFGLDQNISETKVTLFSNFKGTYFSDIFLYYQEDVGKFLSILSI